MFLSLMLGDFLLVIGISMGNEGLKTTAIASYSSPSIVSYKFYTGQHYFVNGEHFRTTVSAYIT